MTTQYAVDGEQFHAEILTSDDTTKWFYPLWPLRQTKSEDRISWIKLGSKYYGRKLEEAPE